MKRLHIVVAVIETATGLALLVMPAFVVRLLLGAEISGASLVLGRVAGVALLALGVACWFTTGDTKSRAGKGLGFAMLLYNIGAAVVLGAAGLQSQTVGIALWPAVILHAALSAWCAAACKSFRS